MLKLQMGGTTVPQTAAPGGDPVASVELDESMDEGDSAGSGSDGLPEKGVNRTIATGHGKGGGAAKSGGKAKSNPEVKLSLATCFAARWT